ncbi:cellulose binding domain-containing protein, partial [Micromonospora sp. Rc5]
MAAGLAAALALAPLALTGTAGAAAAPTASFTKVNDWGSGWEGSYRITNSGSTTISSWRLEFDL